MNQRWVKPRTLKWPWKIPHKFARLTKAQNLILLQGDTYFCTKFPEKYLQKKTGPRIFLLEVSDYNQVRWFIIYLRNLQPT